MTRILVIEDDPLSALVLEKLLTRLGGFTVTATEDAEAGLALAQQGLIDGIIMDVSLSNTHYQGEKVDGLALSRLLKTDPRTARIPILLATAHAMRGDRERFLSQSLADGYISKPITDYRQLCDLIASLIQRALDPDAQPAITSPQTAPDKP